RPRQETVPRPRAPAPAAEGGLRVGGPVSCVAFAPAGKHVAAGSEDEDTGLRVWDAGTGKELYHLDVKGGGSALAFSRDGTMLAAGGKDRAGRLLDAATGEPLGLLHGHRQGISSLVFTPDDKYLISGDHDGVVRMWDVARGKALPYHLDVADSVVHSLALSSDGRTLAAGCECREKPDRHPVILFDLAMAKQIFPPKDGQRGLEHRGAVRSLAFAPDGDSVASGGLDGRVILW